MKKRFISCLSLASLMAIGLSVVLLNVSKETEEVKGYDASTLPAEIDLNDCSASDIRSYYSSLNNKSTSERQGNNLLKNLKTILKTGQKYYSYENGESIWKMYEITDRDWSKSPASSISGYDAKTNKIKNYSYRSSDPYVRALYVNRNVDNQTTAWSDHQQTQWGINREHVWPKAEGFDSDGSGGARGDPMHLMAGNGYANNIHSNYFYGYVKQSGTYTDCGTKYSNLSGNLRGTSKTLNTGTVFEPQDSDKGDIARIIFYMAARYNYLSGSDSDGIDTNNPNLALTQSISNWSSSGFTSSTSKIGYLGVLTDLLAWHHADPVDEYEIHRNNLLYKNFTNNRNPFVDFPEWADFIWGSVLYSGSTYKSYDSTPTGYATPSSDTINGYNPTGPVSVTGVSLDKITAKVSPNATITLTPTISPLNATNQNVTWTSSDTSVATVSSSGVVTGKNDGETTITVRTSDGGYTASCTVTVLPLSSIAVSGQTTTFTVGDTFDFGGVVTATYSDESEQDVTDLANISECDLSTVGEKTVTVSYGGESTTYKINVIESSSGVISGTVTAVSGIFDGWEKIGTGSYDNGSCKFDTSGDNIYRLDIFDDENSAFITNLKVTINGKWNAGSTSGDANSYKVEAISGSIGNITVKNSVTKTGADVFTSSFKDVDFEIDSSVAGTTGIRFTYQNKASGNLAVKSISWSATYELPTSIEAELKESKVFYVGETITQDDIVVTTDLGQDVTSLVSFEDYQFTYDDAPSGGEAANKSFLIIYNDLETQLTVSVKRKAFSSGDVDVLDRAFTGVTGTGYSSWSGKVGTSGAIYAGNSAGGYSSIQLRTNESSSGIVTTTSGGTITSVYIKFSTSCANNREVKVYYKDSTYSAATDLHDNNKCGTLAGSVKKTDTVLEGTVNITGSHGYIGIRSGSGALYIEEIKITYASDMTASNVSNYIMFEDTVGQCNSKTTVATGYFEDLSASERNTFMTSDDYVISTARERLNAWLRNQGKTINYSDSDYVISGANNIGIMFESNSTIIIVTIFSTIGMLSIFAYFYFRRKKRN